MRDMSDSKLNLLSLFPFEASTTVTVFALLTQLMACLNLTQPSGLYSKNAAGRLKKSLFGVHPLCIAVAPFCPQPQPPSLPATVMHLHGTSVQSSWKGWFPGLPVWKPLYEWLKAMRSDREQKEVPLFWLNTALMPWNCVAGVPQRRVLGCWWRGSIPGHCFVTEGLWATWLSGRCPLPEQRSSVAHSSTPAHGREVGSTWSLRSCPTQGVLCLCHEGLCCTWVWTQLTQYQYRHFRLWSFGAIKRRDPKQCANMVARRFVDSRATSSIFGLSANT